MRRRCGVLVAVASVVAVACATGPEEGCFAGEFPAVCTTITGTVVDTAGAALAGLSVGPRYTVELCLCTTNYASTDEGGRYSFRIAKTVTASPDESWPDTVPLYVVTGSPDEGWIDSVFALVVFDPEGIDNEVNLVLAR